MLRNGLEPWHIAIIAIVVLILFGSKKMPDAARSFGRSLRIFKAETKGLRDDGKTDDSARPSDDHDAAEHLPPALPPSRNTGSAPDTAAATDSRDQR